MGDKQRDVGENFKADRDNIDTCKHSLLPIDNRMWCSYRDRVLIRGYCEICPSYDLRK